MNTTNEMQLYRLIYYSYSILHVSDDVFAHHQGHLIVFTVSGNIHRRHCRAGVVDEMEIDCIYSIWQYSSYIHLTNDTSPAATSVNITRYCKYSQMLLMMGENIARNM